VNQALVQATQSELDRHFRLQKDRDNCVDVDPSLLRELSPASTAVDLDFHPALDRSDVNL